MAGEDQEKTEEPTSKKIEDVMFQSLKMRQLL